MKNSDVRKYGVISALGLAILLAGLGVLLLSESLLEEEGFSSALVYLSIVVGAGVFGGSGGVAIKNNLLKKDPTLAKEIEIEVNDERNIEIGNKAKAKAFGIMLRVYGALIVVFALMQVELLIIIALAASYLSVIFVMIYHHYKYQKEL